MENRTEFIEEICELFKELGKQDQRICQVFENIRHWEDDLFYVENSKFLELLKKYKEGKE